MLRKENLSSVLEKSVPSCGENKINELEKIAKELRVDILVMLTLAESGHTGGSLSIIDLITVLYFEIMRHNPRFPKDPNRDRLILSKGHAAPALYAALARSGYFPREELWRLRQLGSILQGHPDMGVTPGVDFSTGSLGQGLSVANGVALAFKINEEEKKAKKHEKYETKYVYAIIGDGESQEGQIWEAAMAAVHFELDNLVAFLDFNKLQIDGEVESIMNIEPLENKWNAFGWNTHFINGHNLKEIIQTIEIAQNSRNKKPTMIILDTVKGKGVSFMENRVKYHGKAPTMDELERALIELTGEFKGIEAYIS